MRYPELPEPWEEVAKLPPEENSVLESVIGCRLTYADMTDDDVNHLDGGGTTPKSLRSFYVMGHQWVRLRNRDTGDEMVVRLQFGVRGQHEATVSAVIAPFQDGRDVTGSQLRSLPVSAIAAAYTSREMGGIVNLNRALVLGESAKDDPLAPLGPGRVTDQSFLARVGRQYDALEEQHEGEDIGAMMSELNNVAASTVRKWLTAARKAMFLMPVASGRKRS